MGWKKLVSISISLLFVSCISFYRHPKGGFRPKKPNFSLANKKFVFNNLIDTMAIYTNTDTLKYGQFSSVSYIKFYSNGRMFRNSFPSNIGVNRNNFIPSMIGYYVSNISEVSIEYYSIDPLNKYNTEYIKQKGFIKNDTVFLKNEVDTSYVETYIKQKLDFIPEPSNW